MATLAGACGHGGGPNLPSPTPTVPVPHGVQAAQALADRTCESGGILSNAPPASNDCCVALTAVGDALLAAGQKQAAYDSYEETRTRCVRFHPVRRKSFLVRQTIPPVTDPSIPMTDVALGVDVDVQLEDDISLAWFAAYLDGQPVDATPGASIAIVPGAHELNVEIYLQPRLRNDLGGSVRMDARVAVGMPRPLAGQKGIAGSALVLLRDRGGQGEITDRVQTTAELKQLALPPVGTNAPQRPSADITRKLRIFAAQKKPGRLRLPAVFERPGTDLSGLFDVCVDDSGVVELVRTLKSSGNLVVDALWKTEMRTWRYRPYQLDGQPRSFCETHGQRFTYK